ncbi:MAG: 3-methylcrotonyl-CoA carboxylase [Lysobacterales bacterium CG02_land_8_20_14_3_00_62_12]|nr:MAG: 3-methylcrotonyl-CoA carboxylase [Xanthomonadales bacterium CG02_land_8_20_14_3_00_62_12]
MFNKVLIANRGEIALRIARSCRRLGVQTVAVYSTADARAQHVLQADQAIAIGGPLPAESYLRGDAIIAAALASGAEAIHPGYGFLSENADFAEAVAAAGLVFIGPNAAAMRKMGSKAGAKELMQAEGVPVVPGYTGDQQDADFLLAQANLLGYPLLIKAAHGGGGKGMRIVHHPHEFAGHLAACQRESSNAFGRDRVLLERYLEQPRHIEFQIFADQHGHTIHLNERECSAQRRYQKVLEESPSPFLTPELRARMGAAAIRAAQVIDYVNAGTVEFIVDPAGHFYFMEINTRLQVEHPVTEMTLDLDLVEWQLRVAAGEPLPLAQGQVRARGHAIEVRLYAEDPDQGFLPGSGVIETLNLPAAQPWLRVDAGVIEGDPVSIFYDPMIGKLIVHGADREQALLRLRNALAEVDVHGPKSNIDFLERLIRHPVVVAATIDTSYLDRHLDQFIGAATTLPAGVVIAAAVAALLTAESAAARSAAQSADPSSPWARADAWRLGHAGKRLVCFQFNGEKLEIAAQGDGGAYHLQWGDQQAQVLAAQLASGWLHYRTALHAERLRCRRLGADWLVAYGERRYRLHALPAFAFEPAPSNQSDRLLAPMPGRIIAVKAVVGDNVDEQQEIIVMEAMKMEITLRAPRSGTIIELRCSAGAFVEADQLLALWEATP